MNSINKTLTMLITLVLLSACDLNNESGATQVVTQKIDPCTLITLEEAEKLTGLALRPGEIDNPMEYLITCVWRSKRGVPRLILKYLPLVKIPLSTWAGTSEQIEVKQLTGLSGNAIAIIQKVNSKFNIKRGLSLVAVRRNNAVVSLSAPFLKAVENSETYQQAITLADTAAKRLAPN